MVVQVVGWLCICLDGCSGGCQGVYVVGFFSGCMMGMVALLFI